MKHIFESVVCSNCGVGQGSVCGEIVGGEVKPGMEIQWPLHGNSLTLPIEVREIDFVDYAPGTSSGVALSVRFDEAEAESEQFLRDLLEVGMTVTVRAPSISARVG